MPDEVVATEELLNEWIFKQKKAEVIFILENENEVGFALFFHNFSTFLGRSGVYLEDLYVQPEYRGKGYGKALLKKLAFIAIERGLWQSWNGGVWIESAKYRLLPFIRCQANE